MIDTSWALRVVERLDREGRSPNQQHSGWGQGPWQDEPDLVEWRHAGLPCLIVRGPHGSLCGYVGVPPEHPLHGKDWEATDHLDVHGGITYGHECAGDICHVARPGEPEHVWWLGFDCAHSGDLSPGLLMLLSEEFRRQWPSERYETYKGLGYVRQQTEALAEQLAKEG